jgi:hypothetical protein
MRRIGTRLLSLATGLAAMSACGGDSGPQAPAQTPTIAISAPASVELTQGAGGTATVTLTRGGGFTGAVSVAVEGLPTGVTAPAVSIASGATSGVVNLTAAATAAVATSNLTFRATGTGVSAATATTSLVLKAATVTPTPGAFSVSLSPATLSLAQGASQNVTATITRTGSFTGAVALAVTGAPAGLTATVTPASLTGTTATIALTAGATLPAGAIALTVTGTGTGAANATASLGVTVTAVTTPNPGTGNVSWSFCGTSGLPVWVAAQDGTGAWTRVTGTADAYAFSVTSGRGGVAYVSPAAGGGFTMAVFYGTTAELQGRGTELCGGPVGPGKTVTGTLAGTAPTDIVLASLGRSLGAASGSTVSWTNVAAGSVDLVASRQALAVNGSSVSATLNKMIIRRGLNPASGSTLPVIDFGAAEAFDPVSRNVTINNLGTDQSLVVGSYITANGTTIASYLTDISGGTATTRGWKGVPTANQVAGDFHLLNVSAVASLTQVLNSTRNAGIVFKDAVDKTVTLGPALGASTVTTIATAPYVRPRSAFAAQTEYNRYFLADYQQGTGALARKTQVQQTGGYAAGAPTLDVPDLSTVAGFDANWGLKTGAVVTWTLSATGWSGTGGVASTPFVEGTTYLSATRMGQFTP